MENTQALTQAIMQGAIEDAKEAVQGMTEAAGPMERHIAAAATQCMISRCGRPTVKQPTFNWRTRVSVLNY